MKAGFKKAKTVVEDQSVLHLKSLSAEKNHFLPNRIEDDFEDQSESIRKQTMDQLTEGLGCTSYFYKMRWPWFQFEMLGLRHPMEVTRYYHEIKLAIDIGLKDRHQIEQKESLLRAHGIRYITADEPNDLKQIIDAWKGLA